MRGRGARREMIHDNGTAACNFCGKFIGRNDEQAVSYTPFGSYTDMEPPDPIELCGKCALKSRPYIDDPKKVWIPASCLNNHWWRK